MTEKEYLIGDLTMKRVFEPAGLTNVSDLQAVFDQVEKALGVSTIVATPIEGGYIEANGGNTPLVIGWDLASPDDSPHPRIGDWIMTRSGIHFWPLDPRPEEIDINDIAHSLAMECRWTGHPEYYYSVAEHSVHVSHLVPPEHALQALLHDASEAYIRDVARPIKPLLTGYKAIEANLMRAILEKFALPVELHASVKKADDAMLTLEAISLMPDWQSMYLPEPPAQGIDLMGFDWNGAKKFFLDRYNELTGG